jgi:hypothetical protein
VEIQFEAREEEISFTIDDLLRALQNQCRIRQECTWNGRIATYDTLKRHSQIYNVITQQEEDKINSCLVVRQLNDGGLICYSSAKDFCVYNPNTRKTEALKGVIGISELSNGKLLLRTEDSVFKYDRTSYETKQIALPSEYKLRTHLSSLEYHGFAHQLQDGKVVIVLANAYLIYDAQCNLLQTHTETIDCMVEFRQDLLLIYAMKKLYLKSLRNGQETSVDFPVKDIAIANMRRLKNGTIAIVTHTGMYIWKDKIVGEHKFQTRGQKSVIETAPNVVGFFDGGVCTYNTVTGELSRYKIANRVLTTCMLLE